MTGLPFRETHHISGRVVSLAENTGLTMDNLSLDQLRSVDQRFDADVLDVFNYDRAVEMKDAIGGTSRSSVLQQIEVLRNNLAEKA